VSEDWEAKYKALCGELMHRLTPGGSEFYMDPLRCIRFAEIHREEYDKHIRIIACIRNGSRLMRWLWARAERRAKRRAG